MNDELDIQSLLEYPIAFHRVYALITGKTAGGVFLSQAAYWQNKCPTGRNGWWYKTEADWYEETMLTRREQEVSRQRLVELGILETEKRGVPARMWYRINKKRLNEILKAILVFKDANDGVNPKNINEIVSLLDMANKNVTSDKHDCQMQQTAMHDVTSKNGGCDEQERQIPHCNSETSSETPSDTPAYTSKPAEGGNTDAQQAARLTCADILGVNFPDWLAKDIDESRFVSIMLSYGMQTEGARRVLAEFAAVKIRSGINNPPALLIDLCKRYSGEKPGGLGLSEEGERQMSGDVKYA